MRTLDLFAGCGGMSLGFAQAGFEIVAAFDHWRPAIATYQRNFNHPIFECDLRHYKMHESLFKQFQPEVIIGGPPCQDFSSAGKRDETLGRADLTLSFAEIVALIKPSWFVMENVDRAEKSATLAIAQQIFQTAGYGLTLKILDASLCGVPQLRKRLFVIGQLGGADNALLGYLEKGLLCQPLTVREYFGPKLDTEFYYRHPRSYKRRAVFSIDEPSPTIRGVNRPIPQGYPGHPGDPVKISAQVRPLTTKERSLIQTFPDEFEFVGNKAEVEQQIGNAVPAKLAQYVAQCILQYLTEGPAHSTPSSKIHQLALFG